MHRLLIAITVMATISFAAQSVSASIVIGNADFEDNTSSGQNNSNSVGSSGAATPGIWFVGSSATNGYMTLTNTASGPQGGSTGVLSGLEISTSSTNTLGRSSHQFINLAGQSGIYDLMFDYRRYRWTNASTGPQGSLNISIYGIKDDTSPGWTSNDFTSSGAPTSSGDDLPLLSGATLTNLGFFQTGTVTDSWFSESIAFNLGDGTLFDQLVIRVGSRLRGRARVSNQFDNFSFAAAPEPTAGLMFVIALLAGNMRRRRS